MLSDAPQGPVNLTEAAGHMPWSEVDQALRIRARSDGRVLEIRGLGHAADGHPNAGLHDTVYVIVSGYGVLRCRETAMECTGNDVIFVPSGAPHHFERLDGEIRIWQISLIPAEIPD